MNKSYNEFINWAKKNKWDIEIKTDMKCVLNENITSRYDNIPLEYLEFLKTIKHCISPDEKSWFICEDEYNSTSDTVFRWNEFERLSLEAAENDEVWKEEIASWWDNYLPIIISVDNIYSFYAVDLKKDVGAVVYGMEPEFEETEKVADNLYKFFDLIINSKIKI